MSTENLELFQKLNRDGVLAGAIMTEHRPSGDVNGRISYSGYSGYGSVGVGWSHDGGNRTTCFSHNSWRASVSGKVVTLDRTAPDVGHSDIPFREVDRYTITCAAPPI